MTYCLNPDCPKPENSDNNRFCLSCGWRLRLGDRFEAAYALGRGQNSRTFVGRDRTTLVQPQCLIKQFTPVGNTKFEREASADRFRRDVEHLAIASQHPQIPDLLAYFERGQYQFLVQQFLVGAHLEQCLQEKLGPFDSDEVTAFLRDVLPILQHLHQNRIIHRDIKPTNFRRPPGQRHWWLVDLGAIKPLTATRLAPSGTLIGSADYAAPEQLRGEATFASDLYSLGVVCLHLLTGLQPFDLFDSVDGCWHWRSIVPEVSPSLAAFLDRLVQPALRDRLPDVATAMASLGLNLPPRPDPVSQPRRSVPWQAEQVVELAVPVVGATSLAVLDSVLIVTAADQLQVRPLAQLETVQYSLQSAYPYISAIAAHPEQPVLATGTRQGIIESWQLQNETWQNQTLGRCDRAITQLLFTAEGESLIVGDDQGRLQVWDLLTQSLKATWQEHSTGITSLALSRRHPFLASGDNQGNVKLWHLQTGEYLRSLRRQPGAISALTWLTDDQALVTAGWDVTLRWRSPQTGGSLQEAKAQGFCLPVRSLLAHPTDPVLITGSQDGQLQCWSFEPDCPRLTRQITAIAAAPPAAAPILGLYASRPTAASTEPQILSLTAAGTLGLWSYPT